VSEKDGGSMQNLFRRAAPVASGRCASTAASDRIPCGPRGKSSQTHCQKDGAGKLILLVISVKINYGKKSHLKVEAVNISRQTIISDHKQVVWVQFWWFSRICRHGHGHAVVKGRQRATQMRAVRVRSGRHKGRVAALLDVAAEGGRAAELARRVSHSTLEAKRKSVLCLG